MPVRFQFPVAVTLLCLFALPAMARDFALPPKQPAVAVSVPASWKVEQIDYGWSATSPGKDVFFAIESADAKTIDGLLKDNDDWMSANKIALVNPAESQESFNGVSGNVLRFDTTDENGPTRVDFIMLPGGSDRVVMLMISGSPQERANHKTDVDALIDSIRPVP